MRKVFSILITIVFILWIIPVATVIAIPSQQERVQGVPTGCLCTGSLVESNKQDSKKTVFQDACRSKQQNQFLIFSHNDFLLSTHENQFIFDVSSQQDQYAFLYKFFFNKSSEHIPKA